jgi:type I restriction enzyme, R subunit
MDRFMPWRTIDGKEVATRGSLELEVLLKGVFEKRRFLDMVLNFVVFDDDGKSIAKKAAAYHQYHAVNKAVECTLSACGIEADPEMLYARFPKLDEHSPYIVRKNIPSIRSRNRSLRRTAHRCYLAYAGKR